MALSKDSVDAPATQKPKRTQKPKGGKFVTDKPGWRLVDPDRPGVIYTHRTPVEVLEVATGSWLDRQIQAGLIRKF